MSAALAKLRYYGKRVSEAPLRVIVQKLWLRAKPRLLQPVYAWESRAPLQMARQEHAGRTAAALGQSLRAILCARLAVDAAFAARARARAQSVLDGGFQCLGYGVSPIPRGADWRGDLFHDHRWSDSYFSSVDFLAVRSRADVKVPWELSRLQFTLWLAEGALADTALSPVCAERFAAIADDWISSNPVGYGPNWICPMEVGIRAVNLLIAYAIFEPHLPAALSARISAALMAHARFIERFPELSDVTGNHYLADLTGHIFPLILTWPSDAFDHAVTAMADEADRQFEEGGCHLERAPVYHRLCLDMVAVSLAVALRFNHPAAAKLRATLDRGLAFCRAVSSSDLMLPILGDADSGQILWFGDDSRCFLALAQFVVGLDGGAVDSDMAVWLLALAGRDAPMRGVVAPIVLPAIAVESRSGFLAGRNGDLALTMRVGAQGLEGRAPHDHDDALSIWVSKGAHDLVVETGCHSYTLDPAIREEYILSTAHNVVQPQGRPRYAPTIGSICKTIRGAPTASNWKQSASAAGVWMEAELATPRRHGQPFSVCRRTISMVSSTELEVSDEWGWRDSSETEIRWHFAPGLCLAIEADAVVLRDGAGRVILRLTFISPQPFELAGFNYNHYPAYGKTVPAQGVKVTLPRAQEGSLRSIFHVAAHD